MLEILNRSYLRRFADLSVDMQNRILSSVDVGANVVSTFDPIAGTCVSMLTGSASGTLWQVPIADDEGDALGEAITNALNQLDPVEAKLVDDLMKAGHARLLVNVEHIGEGRAEIVLLAHNRAIKLATLADQAPVRH